MKIEDLKAISYKILKSAQISSLPVDSHKLLSYYDVIPEKLTDVENNLKYLIADRKTTLLGAKENSTLIYNDTIVYSDYMIIHRFCEKILKSSDIRDIEILTLLIMSPPVIVGYLGVYDVRQMSELCKYLRIKYINIMIYMLNCILTPIFSFWNYLCRFCVNISAKIGCVFRELTALFKD